MASLEAALLLNFIKEEQEDMHFTSPGNFPSSLREM